MEASMCGSSMGARTFEPASRLPLSGRVSTCGVSLWSLFGIRPLTSTLGRRACRLAGFNERIVALYARGMTVRDIQAPLAEPVYAAIYLDWMRSLARSAIRGWSPARRPTWSAYLAVGTDPDGYEDVLDTWIAVAEGAKFWLRVCNELANRGVDDVIFVCVDGLEGLRPRRSAALTTGGWWWMTVNRAARRQAPIDSGGWVAGVVGADHRGVSAGVRQGRRTICV